MFTKKMTSPAKPIPKYIGVYNNHWGRLIPHACGMDRNKPLQWLSWDDTARTVTKPHRSAKQTYNSYLLFGRLLFVMILYFLLADTETIPFNVIQNCPR